MDTNSLNSSSYQLVLLVVEVNEVDSAQLLLLHRVNFIVVLIEEDVLEFGRDDQKQPVFMRKCNCRNRAVRPRLFHHFDSL